MAVTLLAKLTSLVLGIEMIPMEISQVIGSWQEVVTTTNDVINYHLIKFVVDNWLFIVKVAIYDNLC